MTIDLEADLTTLLRTITDIESVSHHEQALADDVEACLKTLAHLSVERLGNTIVATTNLGRDQRVIVAGHLDTVPVADNLPSWEEIVDGEARIYGRGTCDMKGGVAVALKAAFVLKNPRYDLTWVFYDNEEVEGIYNGLRRVAKERPDLLAADFAVLGEPTGAHIEGGCQGTMRFIIETRGLAAHSARSWLGENAIHSMQDVLSRLSSFEAQEVVVEGLTYREGLNAVRIFGGVAGNVIPDRCRIEVNYRFAPHRSSEEALSLMRDHFKGYELEVVDMSAAARPGLDASIARDFVAAVGGTPRAKYGWTDVARFTPLGIPAVNFGPADPGKAHADDEYCPVADLEVCYEALVSWLNERN